MRHLNNLKYMAMALFVAMLSLSFTACSDDDDDSGTSVTGTSIVGTWSQGVNDDGEEVTIVFNSNGNGTVVFATYDDISGDEIDSKRQSFQYSYDAEDRLLSIIGSQLSGDWHITLTSSRLKMEGDYETYVFTKM